ncbi:lysozyme [Pseudomonas rhizoryzae]|uniref:lysozyme n=1 Tax=Pseudomonas rhizoryzae TaxID=2571129 RepID=UPI0010C1E4F8|nr:lysozyme [Pseudomonas rhizoryzae]
MRTSPEGIALMHHYESCRLVAYPDPGSKDGHPWTIGWGHTGPDVKRGLVWTQAQADAAFLRDLQATEYLVEKMAPAATQAEFDALVSFAYNLGATALRNSTLMRLYKGGDKSGAADQFLRWNKNDGVVMYGLTRRRTAERSLFLGATSAVAIAAGDQAKRATA